MVNIDGLTTETVNEATKNIDELDSLGIVTLINNEDKKVALAVEKELPSIARAVDEIAARFKRGGRIIYCGAGSSGRMGTLDAVELTPTYSVSPDRAFGLLAGGETAMYKAVEGAEDSKELALEDLKGVQITKDDCIIGIAASGRTPYTISALEYANEVGALSISITCNGESEMAKIADISIAPVVGAEAVSGSTRMKAGTAQKMVVNMLSTATMIRLGKVYHNYMVQVQPTNEKLVVRATKMIAQITGVEEDKALAALESAGLNVPEAIIMLEGSCDRETARKALDQADGQVRKAIEIIKK
ncbi:MAG: N-acetylmuramic acid 6-phosphate etherase [Hungatella hathewayi]|nr:N-acetylmuramic acid 6-phosphate etherase [Hungatella hathewayi]